MSETTKHSKSSQRADEFVTNFGRARILILKRIENLKEGEELNSKLTVLSNDVQEMSTSLHDATLFLPPFSIKMRQEEIRELEKALKSKEEMLVPKKKFGFKSKIVPKPNSEEVGRSQVSVVSENVETIVTKNPALTDASHSNYFTVENLSHQSITYENSQMNRNDVLLRNIRDSTINLFGSPSTLRLYKLTGCKLLCGPVFTSIFIEDCHECTFFLCSQQLRVHSSDTLDIYLRVRSRAVIEDCSYIRFGPYTWDHPDSVNLHNIAEISDTLERFECVDDFNWLAFTTPSPNWSIIPVSERLSTIDLPHQN